MAEKIVDFESTKIKMVEFCSKSEHCEWDVRHRLKKHEISDEDINKIIYFLREHGLLDDDRFATIFARHKHNISGWGIIRIETELKLRRLPLESIRVAIERLKEDINVEDKLSSIIESKLRSISKSLPPSKIYDRLIRFGMYRGYQYDDVRKIVSKIIDANVCEN